MDYICAKSTGQNHQLLETLVKQEHANKLRILHLFKISNEFCPSCGMESLKLGDISFVWN